MIKIIVKKTLRGTIMDLAANPRQTFPYYFTWCEQQSPLYFEIERTDAISFYTRQNKRIFDLSSISYQASFGIRNAIIENKIKQQLDQFAVTSPKAVFNLKNLTTKRLLHFMQRQAGKIFYTTSGAETIENALKMARDVSGKKIILSRNVSYHGATLGALSITGDWRHLNHLTLKEYTVRIPEPFETDALDQTEKIIRDTGAEKIAAFCLETITGGNGVYIPSREWWQGITQLCKKYNILLILDEVICGFYRTGKAFGYMNFEIDPDFIVLSKSITGGMIPFGALWTSSKIADFYQKRVLSCGLTSYAHPLGLAALSAVLDIVESKDFILKQQELTAILNNFIKNILQFSCIKEVRAIGLLAAIELHRKMGPKEFLDAGIYLNTTSHHLILAPNYAYTSEELQKVFAKLKALLKNK